MSKRKGKGSPSDSEKAERKKKTARKKRVKKKTRKVGKPKKEETRGSPRPDSGKQGARQAKKSGEIRYASPSHLEISCPRCGSPNTEATGTNGPIQRRRCLAPTCRHPFKVARRRILDPEN